MSTNDSTGPAGDATDRDATDRGATDQDATDRDADRDTIDQDAVVERLRRVDDPELDRSIVELDYVESVEIDGGRVRVAFVLPTAWCSPAFAWMMATGIRDEVGSLPGVAEVTIDLRDHMHDDEITTGVNERRSFQAAFPDAEAGIDAVRQKLDEKARLARQHAAVEALLEAGVVPEQIVDLERDHLERDPERNRATVSLRDGSVFAVVDDEPLADYLEKARATGLVTAPDDPLFADPDGDPIDPEAFELVQARARSARVNVSGQGHVCDALHESRNGTPTDD